MTGATTGVLSGGLAGIDGPQLLLLAIVLALAWPLTAFVSGLYASNDLQAWASGVAEAQRLLLACSVLSWPILGLAAAFDADHPVGGALAGFATITCTAGVARAVVRAQLHRVADLRQRAAIVGSGVVAARLVDRLRQHPELGLTPIGYIDDRDHESSLMTVPPLGRMMDLRQVVSEGRVDRVMIAFTSVGHFELLRCIRICRDAGVGVDVVPRLFEFLHGAQTINQIGGMPLMSIDPPTFSRPSRAAKRAFDVVGALLGLIALAPLLVLIAVAIKLDSGGPVMFTQKRAGWRGRFFRLYKFRSMSVGSIVMVRDDGAIVKSAYDDRTTRVGRLIRRFSLDEAPQLFNVLKGDMSLVGPRPLVVEEAAALSEDWQARRADLRPGLTGPWQVAGRSDIPFHEMIQFDYQYVAGWSLARDLELMLATVPVVLTGRGAY